jgi:hypothetical protein
MRWKCWRNFESYRNENPRISRKNCSCSQRFASVQVARNRHESLGNPALQSCQCCCSSTSLLILQDSMVVCTNRLRGAGFSMLS